MTKIKMLFLISLLLILNGCQPEEKISTGSFSKNELQPTLSIDANKALIQHKDFSQGSFSKNEPQPSLSLDTNKALIQHKDFSQASFVSIKSGEKLVVIDQKEELSSLQQIISSCVKEPGIVNMIAPEYQLIVKYDEQTQQSLNVWIGEAGQKSVFMNVEDTHTIYTVSEEKTDELIALFK